MLYNKQIEVIMKIIVFEGLDKSGKHTLSDKAVDVLRCNGNLVAKMEFPRYDTEIGKLIKSWLHGEYPVDAHTFELLLAADKQSAQAKIETFDSIGYDYIVMDRYIHSQLAYGKYDNKDSWVESLIQFTRNPDYVIYMDVDPDVSMGRQGQHGDNDKYESDFARLKSTQQSYYDIFNHSDLPIIRLDANKTLDELKVEEEIVLHLIDEGKDIPNKYIWSQKKA